MIAYRFQTLPDYPSCGVIVQDNKPPRPALFLTPQEAKEIEPSVHETTRLTVAKIQIAVAEHYEISPQHMRSKARDRKYARARQMAMLLSRELTTASLPDIGHRFGGRDHSTVIYGIREMQKRIASDPRDSVDYEALRERLVA